MFEPVNLSEVNENTGFAHTGDNDLLIWRPFVFIYFLWLLVFGFFFKEHKCCGFDLSSEEYHEIWE